MRCVVTRHTLLSLQNHKRLSGTRRPSRQRRCGTSGDPNELMPGLLVLRSHIVRSLGSTLILSALLSGCGGGGGQDSGGGPAPVTISTTSLPDAQVGVAYDAALAARGGTAPYIWSLAAGSLPQGLSLNADGTLAGSPSASASDVPLTFKVLDSGVPQQSVTASLPLTVRPAALLTITNSALPNAQVGKAYTTTLSATGGSEPYTWALASGVLPAGLVLNTGTGVLSGTPSVTAAGTPLTFTVHDASTPAQSQSVSLALNVSPAAITVSISPRRAALTVTQTLNLVASTDDYAGVVWSTSSVAAGLSAHNSASGTPVVLTAPSDAGVYTVTATSVTDATQSAVITIGVSDLAGVYTYHGDAARDGANTHEYALTPANVNTTSFGKLFSCSVDGAVYAQPLWAANINFGGTQHNVLLIATAHDSVYAFDADTTPCNTLWHANLIDGAHGASSGETSVPSGIGTSYIGQGYADITPEVGVIGTPVIDPQAGIVYVVSKSMNAAGTAFYQRLHAIDIITGTEKAGSPAVISGTFPGSGSGGSSVAFSARQQNQRTGLALVAGTVYVAWASHEDAAPWYGWMMGYSYAGAAFTSAGVFNTAPNHAPPHGGAGIWMSGGAPAVDSNGNIYVTTGNGLFDVTNASGPHNDYGDSFLQLTAALNVTSWFTPSDQAADDENDDDLGAGGAALVINLSSGPLRHLLVGGGKDGGLYLLNGDSMGGLGDGNALQTFNVGYPIYATSAFWNNTLYLAPAGAALRAYAFDPGSDRFNAAPSSQSPSVFAWPGSTPTISASGSSNAIVWGLDTSRFCTPSAKCGPAVLHAYNATSLGAELWNSSMIAADAGGNAVKFTLPTVANGKVYIGTRGNNTGGVPGSTSSNGEVDVYGLKPN